VPLRPLPIPAILVTATDTGVGKTIVSAGIADWFRRRGKRVAVLKPMATGCEHRREGLVSEDAEWLAAAADTRHPLDLICPIRYAEPLAPAVAARRAQQPVDWDAVQRSIDIMSQNADVMIVEGAGGVLVPLDDALTVQDLIVKLGAPAVIVARPGLGTINHTALTAASLIAAGARVAGVVINAYPAEMPDAAEETNPAEIERLTRLPVLTLVPRETITPPILPPGVVAAMDRVDWQALLSPADGVVARRRR
jgi:dethiobiotin synthetase